MDKTLLEELWDAVVANNLPAAEHALARGADIHGQLEDGTTVLYAAVITHDPGSVSWALGAGARVADEQPEDGHGSVHAAAEHGDGALLKLLLDVDGKLALGRFDYIDRTPLICAAHAGHLEAARLLLSAGSDVNAHNEAKIGETALSRAVEEGHEEMVRLLLAAGADPNIEGWMRLTALDRAAKYRDSERAELRRIYESVKQAGERKHN